MPRGGLGLRGSTSLSRLSGPVRALAARLKRAFPRSRSARARFKSPSGLSKRKDPPKTRVFSFLPGGGLEPPNLSALEPETKLAHVPADSI